MQTELRSMLRRFRRADWAVRMRDSAVGGATCAGLLSVAGMIFHALGKGEAWPGATLFFALPAWAIPAGLLPVGGLLGLAVAMLRRPSTLAVACRVDRRCGLNDRLGTAAELLAENCTSPEALCVYAQALQAGEELSPRNIARPPPGRGPVALSLTLLLCFAMLLLPPREKDPAGKLLSLSAGRREDIAARLRRSADSQRTDQTKRLLLDLAKTIETKHQAELRRILADLGRAGVSLRELSPEQLAELPLPETGTAAGRGPSAGPAQPAEKRPRTEATSDPTEATDDALPPVRLYDSRYTNVAAPAEDSEHPAATAVTPNWPLVENAASAYPTRPLPHEYRPILRAFVAEESPKR